MKIYIEPLHIKDALKRGMTLHAVIWHQGDKSFDFNAENEVGIIGAMVERTFITGLMSL